MNSSIEIVKVNLSFAMGLARQKKEPYQAFEPSEVKNHWTWQLLHELPVLDKAPAGWTCVKSYLVSQKAGLRARPDVDEREPVSFVELVYFLSMFLASTTHDMGFTRGEITRDVVTGHESIQFDVWVREGAVPAQEGLS